MSGRTVRGSEDAEYQALVTELPPTPIRDALQCAAVQDRIDGLLALPRLSPAEADYLDLLTRLLRAWEDEHVEIPRLSGVELVKVLCQERGIPQRALTPIFGTPSTVSEVLRGKRELRRQHIEGLASFFHVSPAAFFPAETPTRRMA